MRPLFITAFLLSGCLYRVAVPPVTIDVLPCPALSPVSPPPTPQCCERVTCLDDQFCFSDDVCHSCDDPHLFIFHGTHP